MKKAALLGAVFLLHCLPFLNRPAIIGGDEPHYALMAHSMAADRDLDLEDDYRQVAAGASSAGAKFRGRDLDRHLQQSAFIHPLGLPLLAAPLIALQPAAAPDLVLIGFTLLITFAALLAGRDLLRAYINPTYASLVAFGVYFSTPLWFYSRTFFTEPYLWAITVLGLWFFTRKRWIAASVLFGLLVLIKETGLIILIPILGAVALRQGWRSAAKLCAGPVLAATLWLMIHSTSSVTFQRFQYGNFIEGAVGLLLDPRHGLLPFAPIALVALIGWRRTPDFIIALTIFAAYFIVAASWIDWRGGSCYGPRLIVPVLPALAIPIVYWLRERAAWKRNVTVALMVAGLVIQLAAASNPFRAFWGATLFELF